VAERTAELTMMNNELRKTAEKIYESIRLKNEFLANVSHELRTPLNAILGYADLIHDGIYGAVSEQQTESLEKIRRNSQLLLKLINDILGISRLESGRMPVMAQEFNPSELIEDTLSSVRPLFDKKGLDLMVVKPDSVPLMRSDQDMIQQVLLNLLSNALKFTAKGRVALSLELNDDEKTISFKVTDTGIGIAPEFFDIIFDQFRQLDGSTARLYGGTGLGLSISRKIASILDGTIDVESKPDVGSSFTLSVPLIYGELGTFEALEGADYSKGRVVVAIDDDADALRLLSDNLESEGYSVVGCMDGDQGIRKVKELLPFAVTLDIMMPYRDGWSVLRELKSNPRTKDIPVVIVSIIDDRPRGYQLGVNDYIVKPINRRELLDALHSCENGESNHNFRRNSP